MHRQFCDGPLCRSCLAYKKKRPVGGPAARGMGFWKEYVRRNLRQQPEWPAQSLDDKGRLP